MLGTIKRTIKGLRDGFEWRRAHGPKAPKVGDPAPDFELCDVHGDKPVRLSQYRAETPVALVFGSFT